MNAEPASESNLEIVSRAIESIEAGNVERFVELIEEVVHPEVEWSPLIAPAVEGTYRGRDRLAAFFEDFTGSFEVTYKDRELHPIGDDAVLLTCVLVLKGRESGVEVEQEMGSVFEFEDGQLRRGRAYPTHAEAREVAEAVGA